MLIKVKGKKGNNIYYCKYNNNNGSYNYTENSNYIAAVLNVLLFLADKKATQDIICIFKRKTFSPISSMFKSNKLKLPNRISSPSLLFNFSGNTYLIICRIVSYGSEPGSHFARDLYYSSLASLARRS